MGSELVVFPYIRHVVQSLWRVNRCYQFSKSIDSNNGLVVNYSIAGGSAVSLAVNPRAQQTI